MGTFPHRSGFIQLLDPKHLPVLDRRPCEFSWESTDHSWTVTIESSHKFDLIGKGKQASSIAIYRTNSDTQPLFILPMAGAKGGILSVGPLTIE